MRTLFPPRGLVILFGVLFVGAMTLPIAGQKVEMESQPAAMFHDWSMRHVLYPRIGPISAMLAIQQDPRAPFSWRRRFGGPSHGLFSEGGWQGERAQLAIHKDWILDLGTGGTAPAMYPAKYTFDVTANPNCVKDFIIFPVDAKGSATQPNLVAFNQLYSGTAGTNGVCNRTATAPDTGTAAEVMWSYNVEGISGGGAVPTSPVIAYDPLGGSVTGTTVAFVESEAGSPAHFHVLAWKSGDGQDANNLQSVGLGDIVSASITAGHAGTKYAVGNTGTIAGGAAPLATYKVTAVTGGAVTAFTITYSGSGYTVQNGVATTATSGTGTGFEVNITSVQTLKTINTFVSTAPAAGSGTATDLSLGGSTTGTDTLSSPFVDYVRDVAYVGNDLGTVYRIKDVFCTSVNPDCTGGTKPAPSIDTSWGTGGSISVCSGELTAPVLDFVTLNVYVGCSDGKLYMITQKGAIASLAVGDGVGSKTYGGIVDAPVVDGVNQVVYAASGSAGGGANGVLVQASMNLSSSVAVPIGAGNQCNLHAPAVNNTYFSNSPPPAGSLIYIGGATGTVGPCTATGATGGNIVYYAATFSAAGVLTSGAPAHSQSVGNPGNEWAPITEFYNPNIGTGEDLMFFSVLCLAQDMAALNVTAGFPGQTYSAGPSEYGYGTSGMIVDNDAVTTTGNYPQASSIYFNALAENAACSNPQTGTNTNGCAVKLTQAAFQ